MPYVNACASVDPMASPSTWEAAARTACTAVCNKTGYGPRVCADTNWSSVAVDAPACNSHMCTPRTLSLDFGLIEDILGSSAATDASDLPCDLPDDCIDLLSFDARTALQTESPVSIRGTADNLMETHSPGNTEAVILGAGQSPPGTSVPMTGTSAYTATSCGSDACPFYLAQFDLSASSFNVTLSYSSTTGTKTVSGLTVGLERPALGLWLPNSNDVLFPPGSLLLRVAGTVSGTPENFSEDGAYDELYPVEGYVFGHISVSSGAFTISVDGSNRLTTFSLNAEFFPE